METIVQPRKSHLLNEKYRTPATLPRKSQLPVSVSPKYKAPPLLPRKCNLLGRPPKPLPLKRIENDYMYMHMPRYIVMK